jgi:flagellum-specific peptidoglycan hydrolase FlgJ
LLKATTPEQQTAALQKAGYSESPTYNLALNKLISAYNLQRLDGKKPSADKSNYLGLGILVITTYLIIENGKNSKRQS